MQFVSALVVLAIGVLNVPHPDFTQQQRRDDGCRLSAAGSLSVEDVDAEEERADKEKSLKQVQAEYETYLLKHTAVIEVHFESSWQIWVRLKASNYTAKSNVEQIAKTIASGYAAQTGERAIVCTVWSYDSERVYAKGYYSAR